MNILIGVIISIIFGYLLGSISNGVLVGRIFFHIDIRKEGSGNAGGTNTGRVLGKKWGLLVIILDMLKTALAIWIVRFVFAIGSLNAFFELDSAIYAYIAGLGAVIGHTFPLYFGFKGGKVVACLGGIVVATNWILIIIGIGMFFIILKLSKYVSLSSIIGASSVAVFSFIPLTGWGMIGGLPFNIYYSLLITIVSIHLIIRHKENIIRLKNHNERKITWMK